MLLLSFGMVSAPAGGQLTDTSVPTVQGPITGPGPAFVSLRPGAAGTNLTDFNYMTEEYFVSGVADGSPYTTRIVVRRPADPKKFSGLVVAEPMHFSGAALICQYARYGIATNGDACLEIDAEPLDIGLLTKFNSARYGSLQIASESQTNDILAQVGRLVRSNASTSPFAGFSSVRDVILSGTSESSNVTRTYMSAYDMGSATYRMPDGSPVYQGYFLTSTLGPTPLPVTNVPTIQMPSQSEVTARGNVFVRPDSNSPSDPFRIYEVAGMSHADARGDQSLQSAGCPSNLSQFPVGAMTFMGLQHLLDWVAYGTVPPDAPSYIETNPNNEVIDNTHVALDQYGNALGGIRTTYLDVPIFHYFIPNYNSPGGLNFICALLGYQTPLSSSVLHSLYKNEGQYISQVNKDLHVLTSEGWWPAQYSRLYVRSDALRYAKAYLAP